MTDPVVDTIGYYDRNATEFAAQTANLDLDPLYQRFLCHVRPGGRILDAGCGVGRDTLAFPAYQPIDPLTPFGRLMQNRLQRARNRIDASDHAGAEGCRV